MMLLDVQIGIKLTLLFFGFEILPQPILKTQSRVTAHNISTRTLTDDRVKIYMN